VDEKRVVFKKGRYVVTKEGKFVIKLSEKIKKRLSNFCSRIKIVGSIRRKEKEPVDVDIVVIPKRKNGREEIVEDLKKIGKYISGGEKRITFKIGGVQVEIYLAEIENWGAMLLAYTGSFGNNIGLRSIAKRKGLLLNQYGLFRNGKKIAGTEKEIFEALGRKYKSPEKRI